MLNLPRVDREIPFRSARRCAAAHRDGCSVRGGRAAQAARPGSVREIGGQLSFASGNSEPRRGLDPSAARASGRHLFDRRSFRCRCECHCVRAHGDLYARGGLRPRARSRHLVWVLRDRGRSEGGNDEDRRESLDDVGDVDGLSRRSVLVVAGIVEARAPHGDRSGDLAAFDCGSAVRAGRTDGDPGDEIGAARETDARFEGGRARSGHAGADATVSLDHREKPESSGISLRNDSPSRSAGLASLPDCGGGVSRKRRPGHRDSAERRDEQCASPRNRFAAILRLWR